MPRKQPAPAPPRLNFPIFLIALFGVLVVVHLWIQIERGFTHGCLGFSAPTGEIAECAGVVGSEFGQVGGVSNVLLGLLFYLIVAGLRAGIAFVKPPATRTLQQASFGMVGVGLLYAGYLVWVQLFQLDQICVLCLISAATTTLLFGLHVVEWRQGPGAASGRPADGALARSVGLRPYGIGVAVLALLIAADVVFMSNGAEADPTVAAMNGATVVPTGQLAQACAYDPELRDFRLFDMFTSGQAAYDGSSAARVRALKVFDPNCPHCATLHQVLEQSVPGLRDDVRFYYQPIALWDHSIPQVQAMYIAREHGNEAFLEMMDLQLDRQRPGGIPLDTLVAWAGDIGLNADTFRSEMVQGKYVSLIRSERQMTGGAGVNSVPKLMFEGRAIANSRTTWTSECMGYFAEQAAR